MNYEATCRAIYDRLFTSSSDSAKVAEVERLLRDAGITAAVRPAGIEILDIVTYDGDAGDIWQDRKRIGTKYVVLDRSVDVNGAESVFCHALGDGSANGDWPRDWFVCAIENVKKVATVDA